MRVPVSLAIAVAGATLYMSKDESRPDVTVPLVLVWALVSIYIVFLCISSKIELKLVLTVSLVRRFRMQSARS